VLLQGKGMTPLQAAFKHMTAEQRAAWEGTDLATAAQAKARDGQIKSAQNLAEFVKLGVAPATQALAYFTEAVETITSWIPGAGAAKERREADAWKNSEKKTDLMSKIIGAESEGVNGPNKSGPGGKPSSSAYGVGQMTRGTFEGLVKKAGANNPLQGKSFEEMMTDEGLQREAVSQLLDSNRAYLTNAGVRTTDAAMYLAHHFGGPVAANLLRLGENASLKGSIPQDQYDANPYLQKMQTVGDLKKYADQRMGGGGYRYGGIASGPNSGYQVTLHGTEAIVPLNGGASQAAVGSGSIVDKLNELVMVVNSQMDEQTRVMRNISDYTRKSAQYAAA